MQFFSAVYSSLSSKALLQLVKSCYTIEDAAAISFLKRGFNDTYLITSGQKKIQDKNNGIKFILRVYKYNWRSLESIIAELKLLNYLNENKISVSFPIKDNQEKYIQTIDAPEGPRYAVLFSFAEGEPVRKLTPEQSFLLGAETGLIHSLTRDKSFGETAHNYDIETQFNITLSVLKPILTNHPEQYNYLLQLKDNFIKKFKTIDKSELKMGVCHGDLQAENFHLSLENKFTFFDFDFFGTGCLVYDIGVFMWYDHKNKTEEILQAFLKGYQLHEKLSETEIKLIPYFSTLRALFQMTLYCKINDGAQLPLWPAQQAADFIKKVNKWELQHKLF